MCNLRDITPFLLGSVFFLGQWGMAIVCSMDVENKRGINVASSLVPTSEIIIVVKVIIILGQRIGETHL